MRALVTYVSSTGNTKKIADAIHGAIQTEKAIMEISQVEDASGFDIIFLGFPVVGESMPRNVRRFVRSSLKGKKVAFFLTHGMPSSMEEFEKVISNCSKAAEGTYLLGTYDSHGEVVSWLPRVMRLHPYGYVRRWAKMGPDAHGAGRPNLDDLARAKAFACSMMEKSQ